MGLHLKEIKTKEVTRLVDGEPVIVDGKPVIDRVPELDAEGNEIVLWAVDVPLAVEAEGAKAIEAYVAEKRAEQSAPVEE